MLNTVKSFWSAMKPSPENTKDRMRWFMIFGIFGAGVVTTLLTLLYTLIVWLGSWTDAVESARLNFLGGALVIAWFSIIVVVVTLGIGGPLGRLKGQVGDIKIEAEGDQDVRIERKDTE